MANYNEIGTYYITKRGTVRPVKPYRDARGRFSRMYKKTETVGVYTLYGIAWFAAWVAVLELGAKLLTK